MTARRIPHSAGAPAFHMAVDEVLLVHAAGTQFRTYEWRPHAISLGASQPHRQDWSPLRAAGLEIVRRSTGGGAIVHAYELTYAVALDAAHPALRGADRTASYERLHAPIVKVLRDLGVEPTPGTQALQAGPRREEPLLCFARATSLDLVVQGRKLVGSAQRRKGPRILQHGSIVLAAHPLQPGTAALNDLVANPPPASELAAQLADAFEAMLGPWTTEPLSHIEHDLARALAPSFRVLPSEL